MPFLFFLGWLCFLVLSFTTSDMGTSTRYCGASIICAAAGALIGRLGRVR